MSAEYHYKRVDIPGQIYRNLNDWLSHTMLYSLKYIVLKQCNQQRYFVVNCVPWVNCTVHMCQLAGGASDVAAHQPAEATLHQTAERFDTLEQAMLYYHAVS